MEINDGKKEKKPLRFCPARIVMVMVPYFTKHRREE
jgi:hypothetical protein